MKKPLFFSREYFPPASSNLMTHVGDVVRAREDFLKNRPSNLAFLLDKRYAWMNEWIGETEEGIEVGAGTGLSKLFIRSKRFRLTDFEKNEWIDERVDALSMPYPDSSFDYIISSNMIHHVAKPRVFLSECSRVLRPGGKLIIQEINTSLAMRAILRIMRHEGYSYDVDVFDPAAVCNDPKDAWSANCAIPQLLFDDPERFERSFPFTFLFRRYTEFFVFPLSGGVIAKTKTVNLPRILLRAIDALDRLLVLISPSLFPLQRNVVLKNTKR